MKSLKQILATWREGGTHSVTFCTFDATRKKGGAIETYPEARILHSPKNSNANHSQHGTINVELLNNGLATGDVRTIRIHLITRFDGEKITL